MGKAKKIRSSSHKNQRPPTGLLSQAETEALNDMPVNPPELLSGLSSLDKSTREATCVALASMFGEAQDSSHELLKKLQRLINAGVVKRLIPRLVDVSPLVRLHSIGALRNMSVSGGLDVCEYMTEQDVITPLMKTMSDAVLELRQTNTTTTMEIMEQSLGLLSHLCESCFPAVAHTVGDDTLLAIYDVVFSESYSKTSLSISASNLLIILTDCNAHFCLKMVNTPSFMQRVTSLVEDNSTLPHVRLNLIGSLLNVPGSTQDEAFLKLVIPILVEIIHVDTSALAIQAQQVSGMWENAMRATGPAVEIDGDDKMKEQIKQEKKDQGIAAVARKEWKASMHTLKLCMEVFANLMTLPDEDEQEEGYASDDNDDDDVMDDQEMEMGVEFKLENNPLFKEYEKSFSSILNQVHILLQSTASTAPDLCNEVVEDISILRIRACTCLANAIQVLPSEVFDHISDTCNSLFQVYSAWKVASTTCAQQFANAADSTNDVEAAVTATLWAIQRRLSHQLVPNTFGVEQITFLASSFTSSRSQSARSNIVGLFGCLAQENSLNSMEFGTFCVKALGDSSVQVIAETLNSIFDVFGDESKDDIFRSLVLLNHLKAVNVELKVKIRGEAKQLGPEGVIHAKETRLNLMRFIKYKEKHL